MTGWMSKSYLSKCDTYIHGAINFSNLKFQPKINLINIYQVPIKYQELF